jgi:thioredoxin reductase (NADPH)
LAEPQQPKPSDPIETEALILGAGPVGLFQAFQLGLQEVGCRIVDALPHVGGQCVELYADKPIYDLPGLPVCSGRELAERLQRQIEPFAVPLHLGQAIASLCIESDGRLRLATEGGTTFLARSVIIAAGVGAFVPRRPALAGLAAHEGRQVHYHAVEPARLAGQRVLVLGGEDAALDSALELARARCCARVTLLHRSDRFKAEAGLEQALRQAVAAGAIELRLGQPVGIETNAQGCLSALQVAVSDELT